MPWKAKKDWFMLNNFLKLNFRQKINLFLRTRGLSRREKTCSISFLFWIPVLFSMFEIWELVGWIQFLELPLGFWNCGLLLTVLGKAKASQGVATPLVLNCWQRSHNPQTAQNRVICSSPQSPVFATVNSPNICSLINERFLEC